jgi:hypothetical protein
MWWKAKTPRRDQMRAYRRQDEVSHDERRAEAEKAVAEFGARQKQALADSVGDDQPPAKIERAVTHHVTRPLFSDH